MKTVFYAIKYKSGSFTFETNNEYLLPELAEKECQERNNDKNNKYHYFVELSVNLIEKEYNYKGFYISKSLAGVFRVFKKEDGKRTYKAWKLTLKAAKECINNIILSEKLFDWQKNEKSYRPYSVSNLIIEKVWNNGKGSLALFKLLPEQKKIKVNSSLATKRDIEKIKAFNEMEGLNFDLVFSSYSYPEYYSHSF